MTVLNFLKDYGNLIITGIGLVVGLITLVIMLVKNKLKLTDILGKIYPVITQYINEAEELETDGKAKWCYVMQKCLVYICQITGKPIDQVSEKFRVILDATIEDILSTPQKKGEIPLCTENENQISE